MNVTSVCMLRTENMDMSLYVCTSMTCLLSSDDKMITFIKNMLNSKIDMKDLGLDHVILGIRIKRT